MPGEFDPYRKWLGIPPTEQPPNHYRLLGIPVFEDDPDVIENAADRQMAHVRTFQSGRYSAESQRLLNELSAAKVTLLAEAEKATYDARLQEKLGIVTGKTVAGVTPPPPPPSNGQSSPPPPPSAARADSELTEPELVSDSGLVVAPPEAVVGPKPADVAVARPAAPVVGKPAAPVVGKPAAPVMAPAPSLRSSPSSRLRGGGGVGVWPWVIGIGSVAALGLIIVLAIVLSSGSDNTAREDNSRVPRTPSKRTRDDDSNWRSPPQRPRRPSPRDNTPSPPGRDTDPGEDDTPGIGGSIGQFPAPGGSESEPVSTEPDAARTERFLTEARQALRRRDFAKTWRDLAEAEQAASTDNALRQTVRQTEILARLVSHFWEDVRQGIYKPKLERDETRDYGYAGRSVTLLRREGEFVRFRQDGEEHRRKIEELEPQEALLFASFSFDKSAAAKVNAAAFLAVDEKAEDDSLKPQAEQLLREAAAEGERVDLVARELGLSGEQFATTDGGPNPPGVGDSLPTLPEEDSRPTEDRREPTPDSRELRAAMKKVNDDYRQRLLDAGTDRDKLSDVAKTLYEDARNRKPSEPLRYALLVSARDLAAKLGNVKASLLFTEEIADQYQVDRTQQRVNALGELVNQAGRRRSAMEDVVRECGRFYQESVTAREFEVAEQFAKTAAAAARMLQDVALGGAARDAARRASSAAGDKANAKRARETLRDTPDDAAALLVYGRYQFWFGGDYRLGLDLIARCDDPNWSEAAKLELQQNLSGIEKLDLAEKWLILAKRERDSLGGKRLLEHAREWFQRAARDLAGDQKSHAESEIRDIDQRLEAFREFPKG